MPSTEVFRVLFLASRDSDHPEAAGGDIHLHSLAEYLARQGHVVTYLCVARPGAPTDEVRNAVRIIRVGNRATHAFVAAAMYKRYFHSMVDIVIEEAIGGLLIPHSAPLYVRKPMISVWYQYNAPLLREQFSAPVAAAFVRLERILALAHRRVVIAAPSAFQAEHLRSLGFGPESVRVVPPGLDWPIVEPLPAGARERSVVYVGKLRRYKCPHHLLDVFELLRDVIPGMQVVVAGRPDGTGFYLRLAADIQRRSLQKGVKLLYSIGETDKLELLRRARLLVLPSPAEGFGIAVLEAHRCGTPTVVTCGVPTDLVQNGVNGLRVPFGDRRRLADAVRWLLTDDETWTAMSLAAWETSKQFTWASAGAKLERVIADVFQQKVVKNRTLPPTTCSTN